MPSHLQTAPEPPEQSAGPVEITPPPGIEGDGADLFVDVMTDRGDTITAEEYAALMIACRLLTLADKAEARIGEDWIIPGTRGAPIANPLVSEARQCRTGAIAALKAAGLRSSTSPASAAGAALAAKRWHGPRRAR